MKAGSIEIDLLTNLARLQKDFDTASKSVGQALGQCVEHAREPESLEHGLEVFGDYVTHGWGFSLVVGRDFSGSAYWAGSRR